MWANNDLSIQCIVIFKKLRHTDLRCAKRTCSRAIEGAYRLTSEDFMSFPCDVARFNNTVGCSNNGLTESDPQDGFSGT